MEAIRELIACKYCEHRLVDPIVLPCGETVCAEHALPQNTYFKCTLCQTVHEIPDKGFVLINFYITISFLSFL